MERFKRFLLVFGISCAVFLNISNLVTSILCGLLFGLASLPFSTKKEREAEKKAWKEKEEARKREEEARKRQEEAKERARKAPGCYSMDDVDILTFNSSNNLLTAGNNTIRMKIRNRNPYDVIVSVSFKYSDSEGWDSDTQSFEVGGNKIRTIETLGAAWHKAKDVTIVAVH